MQNQGVTAGLKIWLVALLVFFALRYPANFSIFLGAIAGLAGSFVVAQWTTKNQVPYKPKDSSLSAFPKNLRERLRLRQQSGGKTLKDAAERREVRRSQARRKV